MTAVTPLVAIGHEPGRILRPFGFDLGEGEFAVADAPGAAERVQVFTTSGSRLSAFMLPARSTPGCNSTAWSSTAPAPCASLRNARSC